MSILRIICSPRGRASESYRLSQRIVERIAGAAPAIVDVDANTLPHVDPDYAAALSARQDPGGPALERGALRRSAEQIRLLREASHIVIATPMHNFTVPSSLKAWIDHVVRVRHTFSITPEGKVGSLPGRPVYVAIASGGDFSSSDPRRQQDFLTPYLRYVLGTVGLTDVTFFSVQGSVRSPVELEAARGRAEAAIAAHPFEARAIAA